MHPFLQYIFNKVPINITEQDEIKSFLYIQKVHKGTFLLEQGQICRNFYFIQRGLAYGFYYHKIKEVVTWFAMENSMMSSAYSFFSQKPSTNNIKALEDLDLIYLKFSDLEKLYAAHPKFERIGRLVIQQYYLRLEERLQAIQFKTASERYHELLQEMPSLVQRVPLGLIANYLGITQETLSRIRRKKIG